MQAMNIIDNSVVKMADGRIGRLDKNWSGKHFLIRLPEPAPVVEIKATTELELLHHPGSIIDAYIATHYLEAK